MGETVDEFRRKPLNPKIILLRFSFLEHKVIDIIADTEFVQPFSRQLPGRSSHRLVKAEKLSNLSSSLSLSLSPGISCFNPFHFPLCFFFHLFPVKIIPCFQLVIIVSQRTHVKIPALMINTV